MRTKWIFSRNLTVDEIDSIKKDRRRIPTLWESSGERKIRVFGKEFVAVSKPDYPHNIVTIEVKDSIIPAQSKEFDCLAVTNVRVFPFKDDPSLGHLKGLATVVLNDQLLIRGLRIMEGENGLFVSYPNDPFYKGKDPRYTVNPITRQLREHIEMVVLEKYQEVK